MAYCDELLLMMVVPFLGAGRVQNSTRSKDLRTKISDESRRNNYDGRRTVVKARRMLGRLSHHQQ